MSKPIMNIFGEPPYKWWMGTLTLLRCTSNECDTIKRQRIEDNKREFNLRIRKTNRGYVLAEGNWESKKTLYDYLSYLNQYSSKEDPIKIHIWNDRPFGNCDFVVDMIAMKRSFKKLNFATIMIRDDNNEWWSITNQLD
jgi:hypothetical protein